MRRLIYVLKCIALVALVGAVFTCVVLWALHPYSFSELRGFDFWVAIPCGLLASAACAWRLLRGWNIDEEAEGLRNALDTEHLG